MPSSPRSVVYHRSLIPFCSARFDKNFLDRNCILAERSICDARGRCCLLVLNGNEDVQSFTIQFGRRAVTAVLEGGAVGTYVWPLSPISAAMSEQDSRTR